MMMSLNDLGKLLSHVQNKYIDTMNLGTVTPQGNCSQITSLLGLDFAPKTTVSAQQFSFSTLKMSLHCLLSCIVYGRKFATTLIFVPSYIMSFLFLSFSDCLHISSLFLVFSSLNILFCCGLSYSGFSGFLGLVANVFNCFLEKF